MDAVSIYINVVDEVIRSGKDYRNATTVFENSLNRVFKGKYIQLPSRSLFVSTENKEKLALSFDQ